MIFANLPAMTPRHPAEGKKRVGPPVTHLNVNMRCACAWALDGDFGDTDPAKVDCEVCKQIIRIRAKSNSPEIPDSSPAMATDTEGAAL